MPEPPMWRRYLRFFGSDIAEDVEDELSFHLRAKVDELIAQGRSRQQAEAEAQRDFGDIAAVRDTCRRLQQQSEHRMKTTGYFSAWRHDIVYGSRQLRRYWQTSLLAIVTLAIGTGAVAAVFSILYAVVLRPLPLPHPDKIVSVWSTKDGHSDVVTPLNFDSWRRDNHSFQQLAALERRTFTLSSDGDAAQIAGGEITSDYFSAFGVAPAFGRSFTSAEDTPPRQHLVVLSHRFWQSHFGGNRGVIGRQIHLDREAYTVLGVMPPSFDLRQDGEQFWIPLALSSDAMHWSGGVLYVYGRLRPHVTLQQAQAEMNVLARRLEVSYPEMNRGRSISVHAFTEDLIGDYRQQLWILLAAVGSVFLIACANAANLLLARTSGRTRELTIRAALGAGRARIMRQLLTECFLLGAAGAALGLVVAAAAIRIAKLIGASAVPRLGEARIDVPVLLILLALTLACTLLSGALPAWRAARLEPKGALAQGERSVAGLGRDRAGNAYIAFEVGLALVLLVAAGLLIRTAIAAQNVRPGFAASCVIAGRTALPATAYATADSIENVYERIVDALAARPGVQGAALTSKVSLGLSNLGLSLKEDAVSPPLRQAFSTELQYVSPEYFATMQIPLRRGRHFTAHDRAGSLQVVMVNETLARRLWAGRDAVGQQIRLPELDGDAPLRSIVGVVADVHDDGLMAAPPAVLYLPIEQVPIDAWHWSEQSLYLVARTQTQALASPELLRSALTTVDRSLPLGDVLTMDDRLAQSVSAARLYTLLLSALGLCGLVLTAAGIYGVVAFFVSRQRAEIGIRMALGATRSNVLLYVVRRGIRPVLAGVGLGVAASLAVSRALASQLFGIGAMDPMTFASVIGILLGVALLACYVPARQAAQIDPIIALRSE